ncbi:MAG: invasion associated locus B family protein [Acidobacteriaceae bacterium]|jgi:invasion protein IalB|nr:invasion associated locus B family protein [Acidobacteriaceae bacterium]
MRFSFTPVVAGIAGLLVVTGLTTTPAAAQARPPASGTAPASSTTPTPAGGVATVEPTSLQENYDDWAVSCLVRDGKKVCGMSQQQVDKDRGQRVLALEITSITAEQAEGNLLLPFGLAVNTPITLQVDGTAFGSALPYRTCLAGGCLVSVKVERANLGRLRSGTSLTVHATVDGGQSITFTLSLKGFGAAFDRTAVLLKDIPAAK